MARKGLPHRGALHCQRPRNRNVAARPREGRDLLPRLARTELSAMDADRRHSAVRSHEHQHGARRRPRHSLADGPHPRQEKRGRSLRKRGSRTLQENQRHILVRHYGRLCHVHLRPRQPHAKPALRDAGLLAVNTLRHSHAGAGRFHSTVPSRHSLRLGHLLSADRRHAQLSQ